MRSLSRPLALLLGVAIAVAACSTVSERPSVSERPPSVSERPADSTRRQQVVALARKYVGAPYRWGGSSPSGFDCSGLVRYVYAKVGVALPHNAAKQFRLGTPVARRDLEPGDLVFFDRLRHNGIYIGNGRFIHSRQTGKRVAIAGLDDAWYAQHYAGARRLTPEASSE